MNLSDVVASAAETQLDQIAIERACEEGRFSLFEFYDAFALEVAQQFSRGSLSWEVCDAAMNSLFTYAHPIAVSGLPSFAFDVYIAFDEGGVSTWRRGIEPQARS